MLCNPGVAVASPLTTRQCLGVIPTPYATVLEMDRKYRLWHSKLHPSLDWRQSRTTSSNPTAYERNVAYQRHVCAAFFLGGLMNLHRPYLMHAPPILPLPRSVPGSSSVVLNPSRERCIESAMELVRVLCDAREETAQWRIEPQLPFVLFHYSYFVFDGAIALVGALSQEPPHPKAEECLDLMYRAMRMLADIKKAHQGATEGEGDTASRALTILAALRKAGRWDEKYWRKERGAPPACDMEVAAPPVAPSTSNAPVAEQPSASSSAFTGLSTFGSSIFDPTCFSGAVLDSQASTSTAIPFSSVDQQQQSMYSYPGPVDVQTTALPSGQYGNPQTLGMGAPFTASSMDSGYSSGRGSGGAQNMVMPFDMLRISESDIDWAAVLNDTSASANGFTLS